MHVGSRRNCGAGIVLGGPNWLGQKQQGECDGSYAWHLRPSLYFDERTPGSRRFALIIPGRAPSPESTGRTTRPRSKRRRGTCARPASGFASWVRVQCLAQRLTIVVIVAVRVILVFVPVLVLVETEHIEEIAHRGAVERYIRIVWRDNRVLQVVPAAAGQRLQMPVALDELHDRS